MQSTYIIAEAGVNHNGSINMAHAMVDAAADAGADAVKFQTFQADNLVTRTAPKANYQAQLTGRSESQYDMLKSLELNEESHWSLITHCKERGIDFLSTPFDEESLELLVFRFQLPAVKLSSGDITNGPLLLNVARYQRRVYLSTGMSTIGEVEDALAVLAFGYTSPKENWPSRLAFRKAFQSDDGQKALKDHVTLLHCTSEYPSPYEDVNLRVLETLRQAFGLPVGLSDHTVGIAIPIAASALGARVIEKHFTLDKQLPGPDHVASIEPAELLAMVEGIRHVEQALGVSIKKPTRSEEKNVIPVRKSLVAQKYISLGEPLTMENLSSKRPGGGISPMQLWDYLGKITSRTYDVDEQVEP